MANPARKKIIISLVLVSFVGFLLTLSFIVWLSFGLFGLVKDSAINITSNSREAVEKNIGAVSNFKIGPDCVTQLQSVSSLNVFFGKPLQETFDKIKSACLPAGIYSSESEKNEKKLNEPENATEWK
jgi:hypothetical protein